MRWDTVAAKVMLYTPTSQTNGATSRLVAGEWRQLAFAIAVRPSARLRFFHFLKGAFSISDE